MNEELGLTVTELVPPSFIEEEGIELGGDMQAYLDETGRYLPFVVTKLEAADPVRAGPGRVVQATIEHEVDALVQISSPDLPEAIETTENHPFFSVTRDDWVEAGEIFVGEQLWSPSGPVTVWATNTLEGPFKVKNLTVEGEHAFLVGSGGVLVHNSNCGKRRPKVPQAFSRQYSGPISAPTGTIAGRRYGRHSQIGSHHIIQDASVRNLLVVTKGSSPVVDIGKSLRRGTPHWATRAAVFTRNSVRREVGGVGSSESAEFGPDFVNSASVETCDAAQRAVVMIVGQSSASRAGGLDLRFVCLSSRVSGCEAVGVVQAGAEGTASQGASRLFSLAA
jgi:hypothetical protein